jgi:hypothetical protein
MTVPELRSSRDRWDQNKIRPTAIAPSSEHLTQKDRGMSTTVHCWDQMQFSLKIIFLIFTQQ